MIKGSRLMRGAGTQTGGLYPLLSCVFTTSTTSLPIRHRPILGVSTLSSFYENEKQAFLTKFYASQRTRPSSWHCCS